MCKIYNIVRSCILIMWSKTVRVVFWVYPDNYSGIFSPCSPIAVDICIRHLSISPSRHHHILPHSDYIPLFLHRICYRQFYFSHFIIFPTICALSYGETFYASVHGENGSTRPVANDAVTRVHTSGRNASVSGKNILQTNADNIGDRLRRMFPWSSPEGHIWLWSGGYELRC